MPLYHMLLDARLFHQEISPALAASWRQQSFEPCRSVCGLLLPAAKLFGEKYHLGAEEPLLFRVASNLTFDRHSWKLLAGEMFLFAASEIPEIQTAPDTLLCLLAPEHYRMQSTDRERFMSIQQAHFGTRDLNFGGKLYRPEQARYNDTDDVSLLAGYLAAQHPEKWTPADVKALRGVAGDAERADELEFAREWFPALRDLYQRADEGRQVVICEVI